MGMRDHIPAAGAVAIFVAAVSAVVGTALFVSQPRPDPRPAYVTTKTVCGVVCVTGVGSPPP